MNLIKDMNIGDIWRCNLLPHFHYLLLNKPDYYLGIGSYFLKGNDEFMILEKRNINYSDLFWIKILFLEKEMVGWIKIGQIHNINFLKILSASDSIE